MGRPRKIPTDEKERKEYYTKNYFESYYLSTREKSLLKKLEYLSSKYPEEKKKELLKKISTLL